MPPPPSKPKPEVSRVDPPAVPTRDVPTNEEWSEKSIYFLMIDRFYNGDPSNDDWGGFEARPDDPRGWHGGDIAGIIDKLDYIQGMGFDAIWISPIYEQRKQGSYHGYWPWDFYDIDGHFGTWDDMARLREELDRRGMLLMVDVVANHTGDFVYEPTGYFERAAPPFDNPEWFHNQGQIANYDDQHSIEVGDIGGGLDDIDQSNPEAAAELCRNIAWLREKTQCDGFRLDTVRHVPKDFWKKYVDAAGVFCMGEVLHGSPSYVGDYQKYMPSVLDFPLYFTMIKVFAQQGSPKQLSQAFATDHAYVNPKLLGLFVDNHDMPRFLSSAGGGQEANWPKLELALTLVFTARGFPVMYYGTEQAFSGGHDPDNREDMVFNPDHPLYHYVARLNELRRENSALRKGTFYERLADYATYAYERRDGNNAAIVMFNNWHTPQELNVRTGLPDGTVLTDGLHGGQATVQDSHIVLTLPARTAAIFVVNTAD